MGLRTRKLLIRISSAAILLCFVVTIVLMFKVDDDHPNNQSKLAGGKAKPVQRSNLLQLIRREVDAQVKKIDETVQSIGDLKKGLNLNDFLAHGVRNTSNIISVPVVENYTLNYNVHVFYYPWYGNPKFDGKYLHWNHPYLPHWDKIEKKKWPSGSHAPPVDIGANFYPQDGPYSSRDPKVIRHHIQQIARAGIGVLAISWYPPGDSDDQGQDPDKLVLPIMNIAAKFNVKVTFHIEPYKGRDHISLRKWIKYITDTYGTHPAFYQQYSKDKDKRLPVFYIYDSYQLKHQQWAKIFKPSGNMTVRGTKLDGIFIGLLVEKQHKIDIYAGGFDGFYTYFATDGFTYGSSWENWKDLQNFAKSNDKIFIPSVGPGYIDTNVRPWNARNIRNRDNGKYYKKSFEAALSVFPKMLSITSFNEWHEGTQIEPAVPKSYKKGIYLDYGNSGPDFYLNLTRRYVDKYSEIMK